MQNGDEHSNNSAEDCENEFTEAQTRALFKGMMMIACQRLDDYCVAGTNKTDFGQHRIKTLFASNQDMELSGFLGVCAAHYSSMNNPLSTTFHEMYDTMNQIVSEIVSDDAAEAAEAVEATACSQNNLLKGILYYFYYLFTDANANERTGPTLYARFSEALAMKQYETMYGMLLACQQQYQTPDKSEIYDAIHANLIKLAPHLE